MSTHVRVAAISRAPAFAVDSPTEDFMANDDMTKVGRTKVGMAKDSMTT